ncbi:MAG: hypothetical protein F9K19_15040 [Rhizobiaceae bacterium]|nr:MAG: hypothetical protein F9K19_15040 [Rhizobiaceae bacterium]CAG0995832.1 hypothetical protein RHIZO_02507 [Rhizobiaceae bacterium]
MKKLILASLSGLALLTVAACSDGTDNTTTQSVQPPADEQPLGTAPAAPEATPSAPAEEPTDDALRPAQPAPAE